jgi:ribonuclease Z
LVELIVLGCSASVPDATHDTVGLVLRGSDWAVLAECGGSPLHKLAQLGVELETLRGVILSHHHPDHLYGLPALVQGLWIGGREASLPICGPKQALDRAQALLQIMDLVEREGMFPIEWHPIPLREGREVGRWGEITVRSTPVVHGSADTLALRFENSATGRVIVYSADTEPCAALIRLALGADILLHEATGDYAGHSTPAEAAEIARVASVAHLALIHYPVRGMNLETWLRQAAEFPGPVSLAQDGDSYPL